MMRGERREQGYSLLEVLVAMVILTACIIPMAGMFDSSLRASEASADHDRARSEAGRALETIRVSDYEETGELYGAGALKTCPGGDPGDRFYCTVEATFVDKKLVPSGVSYGTRLLVEVEVKWSGNSHRASGLLVAGQP